MKRMIICSIVVLLSFVSQGHCLTEKFLWGGEGYDQQYIGILHDVSSRFVLFFDEVNPDIVMIRVDDVETVSNVAKMQFVSKRNEEIFSSKECHKTMRHFTAPWVCAFLKEDILTLSGDGFLVMENYLGRKLLTAHADLSILKLFVKKHDQDVLKENTLVNARKFQTGESLIDHSVLLDAREVSLNRKKNSELFPSLQTGSSKIYEFTLINNQNIKDSYFIDISSERGWFTLKNSKNIVELSSSESRIIEVEAYVPEEFDSDFSDMLKITVVSQRDTNITDSVTLNLRVK